MKQDFIDFCSRWIAKAQCYQTDDLSDCFDKFVTLYILFNSQYNYLTKEDDEDGGDRHKATIFIKQFIDCKKFCEIGTVTVSLQAIIELIGDRVFYLKDEAKDSEIVSKMQSSDFEEKIEGILEMIYQVRCNLFHGDKSFVSNQKMILLPCIVILEKINEAVFEYIENKLD